MKISTI